MPNKIGAHAFGLTLLLCFSLLSVALNAQKEIATQNNSWYMYFGNHRLSERWGIHSEYQWRREGRGASWQQSLMRIGVDYYSKAGPQLTAGYGWIVSFPYGQQPIPQNVTEHRIWQQLILEQQAGRFYFHHRYRIEQRFIGIPSGSAEEAQSIEWIFRQRGRYRLYISIPLSRKRMEDNTLFLGVYDEVFLGFGKGIGTNILDQNRLYAALGWRFNKGFNIQMGYLNQYVVKADGIHSERNHTFQLALTYNLDFRSTIEEERTDRR